MGLEGEADCLSRRLKNLVRRRLVLGLVFSSLEVWVTSSGPGR